MIAELRNLFSLDVDLLSFFPEREDCFVLQLRAMIGPKGQSSEESFDIQVCTPRWMLENCQEPMWGRHLLVVPGYDMQLIRSMLNHYCESCTGATWHEVANKISRIGKWEFEDYQINAH